MKSFQDWKDFINLIYMSLENRNKCMVVDDFKDLREALVTLIEMKFEGIEVIQAGKMDEAILKVQEHRQHLLFLLSELELFKDPYAGREITKVAQGQGVPYVARMSGRYKKIKTGDDGVLEFEKPYTMADLESHFFDKIPSKWNPHAIVTPPSDGKKTEDGAGI